MTQDLDVLIAGGGLVGLTLGLALSGSGLRVRLVDPAPAKLNLADERHLALSAVTVRSLRALGAFPEQAAEPIRAIHVSSAGEFGAVRWSAAEAGRADFGQVVAARTLLGTLRAAAAQRADLELTARAEVVEVQSHEQAVHASVRDLDSGEQSPLSARLLVIADGVESRLRTAAGIGVTRHDYQRSAICCALWPERAHQGVAYERFTRSGPIALLPQEQGRCGAVWVVPQQDVDARMALPDAEFMRALQEAFGYRLGRIRRVGTRLAYPLRRVLAERLTAPRQVLIGNAAQAVHPVGAQGFNLGLRDATALAEALRAAQQAGTDPGAEALLASYAEARQADRRATTGLSHALALGTSIDAAPMRWLRSLALLAADRLEPLREHLQLGGMGYRGHTALWARR